MRTGSFMVRFESWPLAGLQVGALTVLGGPRMADGTAPRTGPTLTVDATGHRCLVDWERRTRTSNQACSSTDDGASTTRLCRVDYDLSTVRWWRRGVENGGDVGSVVLCLDTPPQLTSGRRTKNGPGCRRENETRVGKEGRGGRLHRRRREVHAGAHVRVPVAGGRGRRGGGDGTRDARHEPS
ncbi:hypothetical protein N9M16_09330 [Candidatus Dependentiae bacterium]|nr:hypothetical protein [Candidatus Dependentiae bacterium]